MHYKRHSATVTGTLQVLGLVGLLSTVCFGADYTVHVVDPPITDYLILADGPLPPICQEAQTLRLSACQGEYEPASFVVSTTERLENVRIGVGRLSGPGGEWPRDALDIRVVKEYYRSTSTVGNAPVPTLLVHDDSFLAIEPDPTAEDPDRKKNVVRGELRDAPTLRPVTIEKRKQFWITVHVPRNAEPGTYRTTVRIVPGNSKRAELELAVKVYPFALLPPMLEYSIYYPVLLLLPGEEPQEAHPLFRQLTTEQYRRELENMLAHGLSNPTIYWASTFSRLEEILRIREAVGMRTKALYLLGAPLPVGWYYRPLTPEERQETHENVRQLNAWARQRGYEQVFWYAPDEQWGEKLSAEHDSMLAVHEAGGKVFVACGKDFFERVGDVLHRPILGVDAVADMVRFATEKNYGPTESLCHSAEIARAGSVERLATNAGYRRCIDGVHHLGRNIYRYTTHQVPFPQWHRRHEGLGLWHVGFDGVMNWAYTHIDADRVNQPLHYAMVYRTDNGVLDTLPWEGFREGVDDVRYLTTLLTTLNKTLGRFPDDPLIDETYQWLKNLDVAGGDLDAIRREMARRIMALSDLGYKETPPEELLADVNLQSVQVIAFPEPWRFKMDPEDQGVSDRWFDPVLDDSQWGLLRTDTEVQGWGKDPGFGWYRAILPITEKDMSRSFKYLYFEAVDEEAWVYLNGTKIFEHTVESTGLPPSELWVTPFVVPLTDVALHAKALLAVRVHNQGSMGGIWKPVHLILSDQSLSTKQVHALFKLRQ